MSLEIKTPRKEGKKHKLEKPDRQPLLFDNYLERLQHEFLNNRLIEDMKMNQDNEMKEIMEFANVKQDPNLKGFMADFEQFKRDL